MKKIALLSCDDLTGYIHDDQLLALELSKEYEVSTVAWTSKTDWSGFDAVIIRSTWDYVGRYEEFLQVMGEIQKKTRLFNPCSVINWNIHKYYLKELESRGINIVPTLLLNQKQELKIPDEWKADKFILKPAISASAHRTTVLKRDELEAISVGPGDWILQPFLENISEGEYSLIFFDRRFSHALLKVPKEGDFRVQAEYGGAVIPHVPSGAMLKFSEKVMDEVDLPLLYGRVDLVPYEGGFALMELELIEPSLYFRTAPEAAANFRRALKNYL